MAKLKKNRRIFLSIKEEISKEQLKSVKGGCCDHPPPPPPPNKNNNNSNGG